MLCETCGGETFTRTICKAKASDIPLRCAYCCSPEDAATWQGERYGFEGKEYIPICYADKEGFRQVDHEATIKAGPIKPPETIRHLHIVCNDCGEETILSMKEFKEARLSQKGGR